ncbi:MAG: ParB/RepB/Spo0J family partition protein [Nitrosopumilus sp.]|nr:ParB/RepB/Spo0J family partition protein [Nitrosopumilus sp.]CAI9832703.1 ParB-like partition protein [Nitrosopumilaceae archaeon]MDA7940689.1 ParB/RepB/Spo0J family partition protein [Nitrosopumilus sp.]MDA7942897.1 ParB/RepB/Spo0J family partition protein [Nitrosopumilus sp.]MDA7944692.1 ParB/RepB/Spo0J family partition protein [Nitrosopumilus sp.]
MARRFKSPIKYRLKEIPVKQITVWKDAQARKLDRDGIRELAKSIKNEGLQNPPMVQKSGRSEYLLMSGQRRLAALKRLGAKKVPVLVLTNSTKYEIDDAKAASVVENLHRNKMTMKDMTAACVFLTESVGKAKAARSMGISLPTLYNYLGFAAVPEKLRAFVPGRLSRGDATKIFKAAQSEGKAVRIAERAARLDKRLRTQYLTALARSPRSTHQTLLKRARAGLLRQKVTVNLGKRDARKLKRIAERNGVEVEDQARKILSSYLKR